MYIVLGATGHVGSAVAAELLRTGEPVTVVIRDPDKADRWKSQGAEVAVCEITQTDSLRAVFQRGRRAFLLNPPAPPSTDTDRQEHRTFESIIRALQGSGLESVVLESTYGAQQGERIGDLSVLFDFEQAVRSVAIPAVVLRAAYYMSNWDSLLSSAQRGVLPTMFPADLEIPMVAPADIGRVAAGLLRQGLCAKPLCHVEGPARYTPGDVANAFTSALGRQVVLDVISRDKWQKTYIELGFSEAAAESYARMIAVSVDGRMDLPTDPIRGELTLTDYINGLVRK